MNLIDRNIEWIVVSAVILVTTFPVFESCLRFVLPIADGVFTIIHYLVLFLLLFYQYNHYKWKGLNDKYIYFVVLYCIYVILYTTIFQVYPLVSLLGIPNKMITIYTKTTLLLGYLICAKTIFYHFNVRKFFYLSLVFCTLSSLLYIKYVGVSFFQNAEWAEENNYIHPFILSYANVPIMVVGVLNYNKLANTKWVSKFWSIVAILTIGYILIVCTKRGPILWLCVNLVICFYFTNRNKLKYAAIIVPISLVLYFNLETVLEWISYVAPSTSERIFESVYEGDTAHRFNLEDQESSNYILGFKQFLGSPVYGSYFRLISSDFMFRGVYPHNIFIEILMTMGLLGFVPFIILLKRAFNNIYHYSPILNRNSISCVVLFLSQFLQLQTTDSIVLNIWFWLFFFIVYKMKEWYSLTIVVEHD